jgi:hypothetical protein
MMQEEIVDIWKRKLEWIIEKGGMALIVTHQDYMYLGTDKRGIEEYPVELYEEFLDHVRSGYRSQYWNVLPKDVTRLWGEDHGNLSTSRLRT